MLVGIGFQHNIMYVTVRMPIYCNCSFPNTLNAHITHARALKSVQRTKKKKELRHKKLLAREIYSHVIIKFFQECRTAKLIKMTVNDNTKFIEMPRN